MSSVGPPVELVVAMLALAWVVVSVLLFPVGLLVHAGLTRWLGPGARAASWTLVVAALGLAAFWALAGRRLPSTWAMANGEEVAFWCLAAGTAMLLATLWRARATSRT